MYMGVPHLYSIVEPYTVMPLSPYCAPFFLMLTASYNVLVEHCKPLFRLLYPEIPCLDAACV